MFILLFIFLYLFYYFVSVFFVPFIFKNLLIRSQLMSLIRACFIAFYFFKFKILLLLKSEKGVFFRPLFSLVLKMFMYWTQFLKIFWLEKRFHSFFVFCKYNLYNFNWFYLYFIIYLFNLKWIRN